MADSRERWAKMGVMLLAALLVWRLAMVLFRADPLSRVQIPEVPRWISTNAVVGGVTNAPGTGATTNTVGKGGTQLTNSVTAGTNAVTGSTNITAATIPTTNSLANPVSNGISGTHGLGAVTNSAATNQVATVAPTSGGPGIPGMPAGMAPELAAAMMRGMPGMAGPPGRPGMPGRVALPPLVQARVDKIVQSELLGPVVRPVPMGLLGIAGPDVFLRTPNGRRVILREGGVADGVKILRIGTNRVLVELAGEIKELMIFSGGGGESLLPKPSAAKP